MYLNFQDKTNDFGCFVIVGKVSGDGGKTWSSLQEAPVGNLGPHFCLTSQISRHGGRTWSNAKLLHGLDPRVRRSLFAYPSFRKDGNRWLAWYFGPKGMQLSQRELPGDWFASKDGGEAR